jgi:transcription antitermination factor NusG
MGNVERNWYVIYTKPRWEKKVHSFLLLKGYHSYCPLNKIKKKYTDRYKVVEEPLFKSYVFIKISDQEKNEVRLTNGVVNFVYWLKKPAIVAEKDIITIKKFLKEYENVKIEALDYKEGQRVKIAAGLLMDNEAKIIKVMKHKVIATLSSIGFNLTAEIDKKDLIPVF